MTIQLNVINSYPDLQFVTEIFANLDVLSSTRDDYLERVKPFLEFMKSNGFHRNTFLDFKRSLQKRNDLSVSTKNKRLTSARILLKEMNRLGHLPADITQNVKSFQQSKKHKRTGLTDIEIESLSKYLTVLPPTPQLDRIKAIVSLLTFQGLRQIEIIRLEVKDIDLVAKTALIQGKGRDDKELIDLHPNTVIALEKYLKTNMIADGSLFVSESNNNRGQRLTTRGLRLIIKKVLHQAGVTKHVHGFRHYFTTKLIESYKGDLLEVARYTRHRNLEMLQVYNDAIERRADLPRYYKVFETWSFTSF